MKVVFMGTPDIAVPCLQKLIDEKHEILAVVTQPDKPKGRGKKLAMPPVKELAVEHDIPVYQPVRARDEEFVQTIKEINPDLIVVVAFGQILPKEILEIPKIWMCKRTCFFTSKIQRSSANKLGNNKR